MTGYERMLERRRNEYGDKFDDSGLSQQFVRYYNSGQRIKVQQGEDVYTGNVGITTGWRPAFLLVRRKSDSGSSILLSDRDDILAVKIGTTYRPIQGSLIK